MMKLSDYVADFLVRQNIRHVFTVAGGACLHLIDSVGRNKGIDHICPHHEQAAAMAADAYSRATRNLGAAIATSGPGATNLITGIACAYYDSVPVLYITGQVASFRLKKDMGVRQFGFQETDIVEMVRPITKYALMLTDPNLIRYELEKATYLAKAGRPGPVLIDIPDDLQRVMIDEKTLSGFVPGQEGSGAIHQLIAYKIDPDLTKKVDHTLLLIQSAKRPVVVLGWGIRLAGADSEALEFINKLGIPIALTWAMLDFVPATNPLLVGSFGLHGTRYGNYAIQNADLLITIGTRLDTHETGSPMSSFARGAIKVIVDVDASELNKYEHFGMTDYVPILSDAKHFLSAMNQRLLSWTTPNINDWLDRISVWKEKYPICRPENYTQEKLNPYVFFKKLSQQSVAGDSIVVDTGNAVAWLTQAFEFKEDQRLFAAFNNTPMGYALPAAIAISLALGNKPVTCVVGDGSLMMNIQELSTLVHHKLPIKIFIINNRGYSMIRQTQEQWLDSRYLASSQDGGISFPDFSEVAKAWNIPVTSIEFNRDIEWGIQQTLKANDYSICDVQIEQSHRVIPQVVFGRPIEDAEPLLPREEFSSNMIA